MRSMRSAIRVRRAAVLLPASPGPRLRHARGRPGSRERLRRRGGTLLIVGGGPIPTAVLERFVALAGGPGKARIVIFPMASEYPDAGVELAETFTKLGA